MPNIEIRLYEKGEEHEIVELLETVFNGWPRFDLICAPVEHWRWKYQDNPTSLCATTVALADDEIIAHSGIVVYRLKVGDRILLLEQGFDLAVKEPYRGQGVTSGIFDFRKHIKEVMKLDLGFWVTANPIIIKMNIKRGSNQFPHPIINYMHIKDINLHLKRKKISNKLLKRFGIQAIRTASRLSKQKMPPKKDDENGSIFKINKIKKFDERINTSWEIVRGHFDFIIERKQDYLNWRYCDPRAGDYAVLQAASGEEVLGFIVLRINRYDEDYPEGVIVDWMSLPDRTDVADALVAEGDRFFEENSVNVVRAWAVKGHPHEKLLKMRGFIDSKSGPSAFFEDLTLIDRPQDITGCPAHRFHFQMGDIDWI